jgi:MraZ protein
MEWLIPGVFMVQPGKAFYTGRFRHTLDDKSRVTIPSAWRAGHAEDDAFLAIPHPGGYVAVLPPAQVARISEKIAEQALGNGAGQDAAAAFFARTQAFSFDKQGRVGLNAELLAHAGITKDAVLVGSLTKFNLYSPQRWEKLEQRTSGENFGDVLGRLGI